MASSNCFEMRSRESLKAGLAMNWPMVPSPESMRLVARSIFFLVRSILRLVRSPAFCRCRRG